MKTVEITLYKFEELPPHGQEQAINRYSGINVDHEWWWESTYEDAERVGLKITSFDDYSLDAEFIEGAEYTANKILEDHGEQCETYQTAKSYLEERTTLVTSLSDGIHLDRVTEGNEDEFDWSCNDLDAEFLYSLREDYRIILQKEYEYLTSDEAIKETLIANEYDFTEDGRIY